MQNETFWLFRRLRIAVMMAPVAALTAPAAADEPTSMPTSMPTEEPSVDLEPDADGDGIPDMLDYCPQHAEVVDGVRDDDGCPDEDMDSDGVPDVIDLCPEMSGMDPTGCEMPMRPRGRPMIASDGSVLRPESIASERRSPMTRSASLRTSDREWIAQRWLEDAQLEYGSVASFARAALAPMAPGAPPEPVAGLHAASSPGIPHADRALEPAPG